MNTSQATCKASSFNPQAPRPTMSEGEEERAENKGQETQRERKEQRMRAALGDLRRVSLRVKAPQRRKWKEKAEPKEILRYLKQFQTRALNL